MAGSVHRAAAGAAGAAGIKAGDIIMQMNNAEVRDAASFNAMAGKLDPKRSVAVLVRRDNTTQYVVIKPRS